MSDQDHVDALARAIRDELIEFNEDQIIDDGDVLTVALVASNAARRVLEGWRIVREATDDPHYVTFTQTGWAIEHSAACRNAGSMLDCDLDRAVRRDVDGPPPGGTGRYRMDRPGNVLQLTPAGDEPSTKALLFTEEMSL